MIKKYISAAVIALMLFSSTTSAETISDLRSSLEQYQGKLKQIESNIKENGARLNGLNEDQTAALEAIDDLNDQILATSNEYDLITGEVQTLQDAHDENFAAAQVAENDYEENMEALKNQLKEGYLASLVAKERIIVSSESITDLIIKEIYYERIMQASRIEIQDLSQKIAQHEKSMTDIAQQKKEIEAVAAKKLRLKDDLMEKKGQQAILIEQIESDRKTFEAMLKKEEAEIEEINSEIYEIQQAIKVKEDNSPFLYPMDPNYKRITSYFGYRIHPILGTKKFHSGVDLAAPTGTDIYAARSGIVIYADWLGGYGKAIIIDHGGYYSTLYGHTSRIDVEYGQEVGKGQKIGEVGSTGMSTGPHLHFEIKYQGEPINPVDKIAALQ